MSLLLFYYRIGMGIGGLWGFFLFFVSIFVFVIFKFHRKINFKIFLILIEI